MFVWGVEGNSKILQSLLSQFNSSVDSNLMKEFMDDPPSAVCKHVSIGSNALEHAITVRSEKATRFVLESADKIEITIQISDKVVEQLLISFDDQKCRRLIKMILDYKIVIVYQDTEKGFVQIQDFAKNIISEGENHRSSLVKRDEFDSLNLPIESEEEKKRSSFAIQKEEAQTDTIIETKEIDHTFYLPSRIADVGEYIARPQLLEIAFRSRIFNRDKDLELVEFLFPDIYNLTK